MRGKKVHVVVLGCMLGPRRIWVALSAAADAAGHLPRAIAVAKTAGPVKFDLIDKILSIDATKVVGIKNVSLAEEYLADHFPTFPVLPGVMMLESAIQACSWVLLHRTGFAKPIVVLKEARNVKYGHFVAPGRWLRVEGELLKETEAGATFKVMGTVNADKGETTAFTARIELCAISLTEKQPALGHLDAGLVQHAKDRWALIAPASSATVAI